MAADLHDRIDICLQRSLPGPSGVAVLDIFLSQAVRRGQKNKLRIRITREELFNQRVQCAAKGICAAIVQGTKSRVAVAKVICSAENDDNVRIRDHILHTRKIVTVIAGKLRGRMLRRDARSANAIAVADRTGVFGKQTPVRIFHAGRRTSFSNAVS